MSYPAYIYRTMTTLHKRTNEQKVGQRPSPVSPHWAFFVQLRTGTPLSSEHLQGRIEHLVSGQTTIFSSLEEARAFMEHVLTSMEEKPP